MKRSRNIQETSTGHSQEDLLVGLDRGESGGGEVKDDTQVSDLRSQVDSVSLIKKK